ncbi:hypothetical protein DEU56DRAFT_750448 [Suillus clintonianus]|uniref:uncharacterized protein n=1 Tax=Suillus clintonianus TaxID=1904413 RepID=UPI001B87CBAB|nr:uncharacterized protein DEU56DRAFT_750448 [Suillus clintonianus]KAG2157310.1 hypothetical protein DEU56DRAFT_750448 [Suillus clintonianus]
MFPSVHWLIQPAFITYNSPIATPRNNSNGSLSTKILTFLMCRHLLLKTRESESWHSALSETTPMDRLAKFIQLIWWPSASGCFQAKIVSGGEHPKADEWRNFMHVYPAVLAVTWNMWSCPPDVEAPDPKNGLKVQQAVIK